MASPEGTDSIGCSWLPRCKDDMGVWQGGAMDSLKFHPGLPCPTLTDVSGVARPQGGRSAAVLSPVGQPLPYAMKDEVSITTHMKDANGSGLSMSLSVS
jgi:hypothetical protein